MHAFTFFSKNQFPIIEEQKILDSKVGSVVTKVCVGFLLCLSPDSDGSESGWWTISIWQLVSRVHCPILVLFYFTLGVFRTPESSIGLNRES